MSMTDLEQDAYRAGVAAERSRWIVALEYGCGDNSCVVHKPHGMATNGGCQCLKALSFEERRAFLRALNTIRADAVTLLRRLEGKTRLERVRAVLDEALRRDTISGGTHARALAALEEP